MTVLKTNSKVTGLLKEKTVAQYLIKKGWTVMYQNKKILGVEIDILAEKNKDWVLIEVKSIKNPDHIENILKNKQKERLKKVVESLCIQHNQNIRLFLSTVDAKNKIEFFEIN